MQGVTLRELHDENRLPERAGLAKLHFRCADGSPGHSVIRKGSQIYIQTGWSARFHPLGGGEQFLLRGHFSRGPVVHCEFGGTDENPFVARLNREAYHIFLEDGEEAFYSALKPQRFKAMEKAFGVSALRQGDIWAIKIPMDWKDVERSSLLAFGYKTARVEKDASRVFQTRHELVGTYAPYGKWQGAVAQGTLVQRPEHADLNLTDGLYYLERTRFLMEPSGD